MLKVYNQYPDPGIEVGRAATKQDDTELVIYQVIDRADDLNVQQVIANSQLQSIIERLDKMALDALEEQNRMIKVGFAYTVILAAAIVIIGVLT